MTETELKDELDDGFLRRQWALQRVGWALMLLIVVLTLLGAFGTSPLSAKTQTQDVGGARYEVEHDRWTRYQLLETMHVRVHAPGAGSGGLKIAFSTPWTESHAIRGSTPDADGGGAGPHGATYAYEVDDWSQPVAVAFEHESRKPFRSPGTLTIVAGGSEPVFFPIDAWVHP